MIHMVQKTTFRATRRGSLLKHVLCEKCSTAFHYHMWRLGSGSAVMINGKNERLVRARAEEEAANDLSQRLKREAELVPCPKCHWVNSASVAAYLQRKLRGWRLFVVGTWVIVLSLDIVFYFEAKLVFGHPPTLLANEIWIVAALGFFASLCFLTARVWLSVRTNPNRYANGNPRVPLGTPPALMKQVSATCEEVLVPVLRDDLNSAGDMEWAVFRPNQLALASLCCKCLAESTCNYKLPFSLSNNRWRIPMCMECRTNLRRRWWRGIVSACGIAILLGWMVTELPTGVEEVGRILMGIASWWIGFMIGVVLVEYGVTARHRDSSS